MHLEEGRVRYLLLVFDCFLAFGCYYNIDIPSALQADLQGDEVNNCGNLTNVTCCDDCLGLGPLRYNQLYLAYSWMNAVCALPAGFIIDRIGNRGIIFTTVASIGTFLFTASTFSSIRRTPTMFPLMFTGRMLLGAGTGALLIIQERIICFWFKDKISISMGFVFFTLRLGNVSNFFLTANMQKWIGITTALWTGFFMSLISVISAIGYFVAEYLLTRSKNTSHETPNILRDVRRFSKRYWLVCIAVVTFYSAFLPFVSNGSKYIQDKYGYSKSVSSYFNGAVYDIALVMSPLGGYIFTKVNLNGLSLLVTVLLMAPVYLLLAYCPGIHPLVFTIWIGICAILGALFLWPFLIHLVPRSSIGTANGITILIQGIGVGLTNLAAGKLLGSVEDPDLNSRLLKYEHLFLLLFALTCVSLISVIVINILDLTGDRRLNARLATAKATLLKNTIDEHSPLINDNNHING